MRNQCEYFYMNYNKEQAKSQKTVNHDCHKIKSSIAPVKSEEKGMSKERAEINKGFKEMRNARTWQMDSAEIEQRHGD